jgi:O-antigen/teichoic acid export membrane protein
MVSCLLFGSLFVLWDGSFLATHAIWFSGAALLCSVFIADLLARKALRPFASAIPRYNTSRWFASVIPLFSISVLTLVNTRIDLFVLSFLANTEAVGLFSVVGRVMVLMSFVMGVFTATFAPRIGTFNEARDRLGLQRQLTVLSRTALAVSAPIAVALLIFGTQVLGLFGKAFEAGELALQILIAGQLVNVVCGAVGMVLNMTGHEHIALRGMILTGLLNLTLDLLLIPEFGINGAAAATTASLIAANVALWWVVRKRMGLDASVIGLTQGVP